jgi:hypothetical protein
MRELEEVLSPVDDRQRSVGINAPDVPSAEPAIRSEGLRCLGVVLEVPCGDGKGWKEMERDGKRWKEMEGPRKRRYGVWCMV